MLDRLRGKTDPEALLQSVPGLGPTLAKRIHQELDIDSLEDLEVAAHDGRLRDLAGIGVKKLAGIEEPLSARLGRIHRREQNLQRPEPSVKELLDVDREYRDKAVAGELPRITPRRFNPEKKKWLPILHTQRLQRHYTALYSNTARAHQLGRVRDWVVLYYDDGINERQATVITSGGGAPCGRRVVRGRESECELLYAAVNSPANPESERNDGRSSNASEPSLKQRFSINILALVPGKGRLNPTPASRPADLSMTLPKQRSPAPTRDRNSPARDCP
jgi:DNA polymerase (family X)